MIRAKFECESVTLNKSGGSIELNPVSSGSPENEKFYKYTPGGQLRLEVVSLEIANTFKPGKEYYLDISPID